MKFKPKIKQLLTHIPLFIIAIVCALSINSIQAYASEYDEWVQSIVDSQGSSTSGGNKNIPHGVSSTKTGYLCYLLDKNGNAVPGTNAVALSSPGFSLFFASLFWTKLQNIFGHCCMSKLDKVAKHWPALSRPALQTL